MADLGDIIGALMSGVIRARRIADEQTAALAEYYKQNPLLEGLSVPRIRIPELTIDMPVLIEDQVEGERGEMQDPTKIVGSAISQIESTLAKREVHLPADFQARFKDEALKQLSAVKQSNAPVSREIIARSVQNAFTDTLKSTRATLSGTEKEAIAKDLRTTLSSVGVAREPIGSGIVSNVRTADVKERATSTSVVRLKLTLREEGLEWATQASESGGVVRTLQPE